MEILIFILIIAFVFSNKKKKASKSAPVKPAAAARARAAAKAASAASATPATPAPRPAPPKNVAAVKVAGQSSPVFMAAPKGAPLPASILDEALADEEGCVGGSMRHTHEEGESREAHKRHTEAVRRREAEELLVRAQAENAAGERRERMRQAVVMAEILGKPRALQRRV